MHQDHRGSNLMSINVVFDLFFSFEFVILISLSRITTKRDMTRLEAAEMRF